MPSRRGRRGRGCRGGTFRPLNTHGLGESLINDDDDPKYLCTWCKMDFPSVLSAACGHQFCRECVENVVLPISACPVDKRYICESVSSEFILLETQEEMSNISSDGEAISALRKRVDNLTLLMDRLVEHLAIRNMVNEHRLAAAGMMNGENGTNKSPQIEAHKLPTINDSDDSELVTDSAILNVKKEQLANQAAACRRMDTAMLCNLPSENGTNGETSLTDLVLTSENAHQLLPRFWKQATAKQWSDTEKVQRLRGICSLPLQRLLDNADLSRKDWAYISSIIYGDHLMDEVSMIRCLGSMRQRFSETPHQWYLRVSTVVERGLPPGSLQDWEVRSAFIRGLLPKYQEPLQSVDVTNITAMLARCSTVDVQSNERGKPSQEPVTKRERLCFMCGEPGHVMRDCPKQNGHGDASRWTPWN